MGRQDAVSVARRDFSAVYSRTTFLHVGETDCVAGVIGLELRNPLGLKSAGIAGGIFADLAKMAQQRRFAFELRRCQRAAAARISPGIVRAEA
jgi:hypothetical protein